MEPVLLEMRKCISMDMRKEELVPKKRHTKKKKEDFRKNEKLKNRCNTLIFALLKKQKRFQ